MVSTRLTFEQGLFKSYDPGTFYDEMFTGSGAPRPHYAKLFRKLASLGPEQFEERRKLADLAFLLQGITFTVYSDGRGTERLFPFDLIPRILPHSEWEHIERGLTQRVVALNLFLQDIYGKQRHPEDRQIPRSLVYSCPHFRREMIGLRGARGIHTHICGIDLVRDSKTGEFFVLEDNVRTPSGISYVLENRLVMTRTFPDAFQSYEVLPVDHYPAELAQILHSLSPRGEDDPEIVLLTPGMYNSAYFEHSFLAQQMGIELVEGRDLVVDGDIVYMKTIRGLKRVDVIYRRVDDEFIDPLGFRAGFAAGRAGADGRLPSRQCGAGKRRGQRRRGRQGDLCVCARHSSATTWAKSRSSATWTRICARGRTICAYVLEHLPELVVKAVGESGGYGMLMGPAPTRRRSRISASALKADPRNYIAQPVHRRCRACLPTIVRRQRMAGRHVDLRPYCLYDGEKVTIVPGGLTRVALQPGSLVVNSSQGGGSKDTWVLRGDGGVADAVADRRVAILAGALHRARRIHRAHTGRELSHAARSGRSSPTVCIGSR